MGRVKKVLIWIGIVFISLMALSVIVATYFPTPEEPPAQVQVEKPKPKPQKKVVKKVEKKKPAPKVEKPKPKVAKKKTQALKLEEIGHIQGQNFVTQCYATNQTGKTWQDNAQVRVLDQKGNILHVSANHLWLDFKLAPKERDYLVAKVPLPRIRPFIIEWRFGRQKLLITYHE